VMRFSLRSSSPIRTAITDHAPAVGERTEVTLSPSHRCLCARLWPYLTQNQNVRCT
jgi:hypothetical protein